MMSYDHEARMVKKRVLLRVYKYTYKRALSSSGLIIIIIMRKEEE